MKEALKAGANRAEIAVKYNVSPSCLSEWVESFIEGKFETEERKSMRQKIAELEAKNELMLKEFGKKQLEIDLLKKMRISGGALENRRFRTGWCKRSEAHSWGAVQNLLDLKDKRGYAWARENSLRKVSVFAAQQIRQVSESGDDDRHHVHQDKMGNDVLHGGKTPAMLYKKYCSF